MNRKWLRFGLGTAVLLVLAGGIGVGYIAPYFETKEKRLMREVLETRISFEVGDAPMLTVWEHLRDFAITKDGRVAILFHPDLLKHEHLMLSVKEKRLKDVLTELHPNYNCEWFARSYAIFVYPPNKPPKAHQTCTEESLAKKLRRNVTFEFVDTPMSDATEFLRSMTGIRFVLDPSIPPETVVPLLYMSTQTLEDTLNCICFMTGTEWVDELGADGQPQIRIVPRKDK